MFKPMLAATALFALAGGHTATAQPVQAAPAQPVAMYDAELAKSLGADKNGMRSYVLVLLKTGPNKIAPGEERTKMFQGHFANITRLANEKKLAVAGPLDQVNGMRGMFVFAVNSIEEAKALVATDPVIIQGEMVAEYHTFFSSAALMAVGDIHNKIQKK
jgi:uncharacterized protein YciI